MQTVFDRLFCAEVRMLLKINWVCLEIFFYLSGCILIPVLVVIHRQQFIQDPPDEVSYLCSWGIFIGLLLSGFVGLISYYLFQKSLFLIRLIVPVVSLVLEGLLIIFWLELKQFDFIGAGFGLFLPTFGITAATWITTLIHNAIVSEEARISNSTILWTIAIQLFLGIFFPVIMAHLLFLSK